MAWIVQPLERKNDAGQPSGLWHLTASSDEGGGFVVGCDHDHASAWDAHTCLEARKRIGTATGFPLKIDTITINDVAVEWPHEDLLPHDQICALTGRPDYATVTYSWKGKNDLKRSGTTVKGQNLKVDDGMHITCVVT